MIDMSPELKLSQKHVHAARWHGELKFDPVHTAKQGFLFTDDDILKDSITVAHQCSSTEDITIGGVYLGSLKLTFLPSVSADKEPGYFKDSMIELYYDVEVIIGGVPQWEEIKVGDYYVKSATYADGFVTISAYDGMCLFDELVEQPVQGTMYHMMQTMVTRVTMKTLDISLHVGMSQQEVEMLPNGTLSFTQYTINDIKTFRDVLYWMAQAVGGFAYVDRDGGLRLWSYSGYQHRQEDDEITPDERVVNSTQISDFITSWDGITIYDIANEEAVRTSIVNPTKLYELGANPYWQLLSEGNKNFFCVAIANIVEDQLKVRPYRIDMRSAPVYDCGDKILFTGGVWQKFEDVPSIVHAWTFTKGVLTLQAFGKDRVKVTNNTGGGGSGTGGGGGGGAANKIVYFYVENTDAITLNTNGEYVTLGQVDFYASGDNEIEAIGQSNIIVDAFSGTGSGSVLYFWNLDGNRTYAGRHSARNIALTYIDSPVFYSLVAEPGLHTLKLEAYASISTGGTASFRWPGSDGYIPNAKIILKGQGIEKGSDWGGVITCADTVPPYQIHTTKTTETGSLTFIDKTPTYLLPYDTFVGHEGETEFADPHHEVIHISFETPPQ